MPNRTPDPSRSRPLPAAARGPEDAGLRRVWPSVEALMDRDAAEMAEQTPGDLADRTDQHITAYRSAARPAQLHPADAAAVDALLAGQTGGAALLPADLAERRGGVEAVLGLLDRDGAGRDESAADLTARTMDAVRAARQRERVAQQIDMLREGPPSAGVSLRQVFSAAAILLLGVTLLLPVMQQSRNNAMQAACATNLGVVAQAFGTYASDHAGVFPRAASVAGSSWWNVGQPDAVTPNGEVRSNSAHLYLLVRGGYVSADRLACQGNADAARGGQMTVRQWDWSSPLSVSYSYQNQFTPQVLRADDAMPNLAVLADKNPLFVPRAGRLVFDPRARITDASRQHGGAGQNVLRIDGSAAWTIMPNFAPEREGREKPDIFWAAAQMPTDHRYTGRELPDGVNRDAFLVP
ncbi:MAG: hypothetical protein AAGE65_04975 [Planctomycetota bacterium]